MKFRKAICIALLMVCTIAYSQTDKTKENKKYILAMIKAPARSYTGKVDSLFQLHKNYIAELERTGKLDLNASGVFAGIEKYAGIYVFNTDTKQKAEEIISSDPGYKKLYDLELYVWYPSKASQ